MLLCVAVSPHSCLASAKCTLNCRLTLLSNVGQWLKSGARKQERQQAASAAEDSKDGQKWAILGSSRGMLASERAARQAVGAQAVEMPGQGQTKCCHSRRVRGRVVLLPMLQTRLTPGAVPAGFSLPSAAGPSCRSACAHWAAGYLVIAAGWHQTDGRMRGDRELHSNQTQSRAVQRMSTSPARCLAAWRHPMCRLHPKLIQLR